MTKKGGLNAFNLNWYEPLPTEPKEKKLNSKLKTNNSQTALDHNIFSRLIIYLPYIFQQQTSSRGGVLSSIKKPKK